MTLPGIEPGSPGSLMYTQVIMSIGRQRDKKEKNCQTLKTGILHVVVGLGKYILRLSLLVEPGLFFGTPFSQVPFPVFENCCKDFNFTRYHHHVDVSQYFQLSSKMQVSFRFLSFFPIICRNGKIHLMASSFFLGVILLAWLSDLLVSREFYAFNSLGRSLVCAYTIW